MDMAELKKRVAEIMVERLFLTVKPEDIKDDESLTLKYGIDSVRLFDMVVGMEDDFDVSFEDEELTLENFDSLSRIVSSLSEKMGE
jgi:acyl carrier protein